MPSNDAVPSGSSRVHNATARQLAQHERRISALEALTMQLLGEVKGMRNDIQELSQDMRQVVQRLADAAARQPLDYMPRDQIKDALAVEAKARQDVSERVERLEDRIEDRGLHGANRGHAWAMTGVTATAVVIAGIVGAALTVMLERLVVH